MDSASYLAPSLITKLIHYAIPNMFKTFPIPRAGRDGKRTNRIGRRPHPSTKLLPYPANCSLLHLIKSNICFPEINHPPNVCLCSIFLSKKKRKRSSDACDKRRVIFLCIRLIGKHWEKMTCKKWWEREREKNEKVVEWKKIHQRKCKSKGKKTLFFSFVWCRHMYNKYCNKFLCVVLGRTRRI